MLSLAAPACVGRRGAMGGRWRSAWHKGLRARAWQAKFNILSADAATAARCRGDRTATDWKTSGFARRDHSFRLSPRSITMHGGIGLPNRSRKRPGVSSGSCMACTFGSSAPSVCDSYSWRSAQNASRTTKNLIAYASLSRSPTANATTPCPAGALQTLSCRRNYHTRFAPGRRAQPGLPQVLLCHAFAQGSNVSRVPGACMRSWQEHPVCGHTGGRQALSLTCMHRACLAPRLPPVTRHLAVHYRFEAPHARRHATPSTLPRSLFA